MNNQDTVVAISAEDNNIDIFLPRDPPAGQMYCFRHCEGLYRVAIQSAANNALKFYGGIGADANGFGGYIILNKNESCIIACGSELDRIHKGWLLISKQ
jgi:hypothetical protein